MSSLFENEDYDEGDTDFSAPSSHVQVSALMLPRDSDFYISNQGIEQSFLSYVSDKNFPHAIILHGPKGIGKATFAFRLSRFLFKYDVHTKAEDSLFGDAAPIILPDNMDVPADDPVFRKLASGGYPDFLYLAPLEGKKGLDVEQIRKVAPFLRKTASKDGGWRIVLIDDADTMNRNAQNALLKILEEPPNQTLLMLVSHNSGAFLPTILSRCHLFSISALAYDAFCAVMNRYDPTLEANSLKLLYEFSNGSPGGAIQFIEGGGLELIGDILDYLAHLPELDLEQIHLFCERFGRGVKDEAWENISNIMVWIFQTLTVTKAKEQTLPERLKDLKAYQERTGLEELSEICQLLDQKFRMSIVSNLDKRQTLLEIFLMLNNKK